MRSISLALLVIFCALVTETTALASTPLPWFEQTRLYGMPDVMQDAFGSATAVSGTRIAVGAPSAPCPPPSITTMCGAAYVFNLVNNQWVQEAYLTAPTPQSGAEYGHSIDIDGNWLIVGAPFETVGSSNGVSAGDAYIYNLQGGVWTPVSLGPPVDQGAFLGYSVAISSAGIAVAGAPSDSKTSPPVLSKSGSVLTFVQDSHGAWNYESALHASTQSANANFGYAVSLYTYKFQFLVTGYALAVGAPGTSVLGNAQAGEGYIYTRNATDTSWTERAFYGLTTMAHEGDNFGVSASVYGGVIAFGVLSRQIANGNHPGSVYVVRRNTSDWTDYTAVELPSPNSATDNFFGISVALWQDTLFVGAPNTDIFTFNNGAFTLLPDVGNAYEFDYDGAVWQPSNTFTASDVSAHAHFGTSVAFRGGIPVVGATLALPAGDTAATDYTGAVYIYQHDAIFANDFENP